tara:strand:- start:192 stop:2009 length:1818 start_codon:yes stop_codon:yes gene_type:complete
MGNRIDTTIVLGSLRYKSAPETELYLNVPLVQNSKINNEFDRSVNIRLQQVYDDERQSSTVFRPSGKFSIIFKNTYTGSTNYVPLENNLSYVDSTNDLLAQCSSGSTAVSWKGFLQYNEFDFIRTDYNVTGYTAPPDNHIDFITKSASTYNWNHFVSYPYDNLYEKPVLCHFDGYGLSSPIPYSWNVSDGLPFIINNTTNNGLDVISFRSVVKHNLYVGEYVELSETVAGVNSPLNYDGVNTFQVTSLGDDFYGSDEYIFNIINVGYTGSTFNDGAVGCFKRIININISGETLSSYYVRRHKLLTNVDNTVLTKAGFEQNGFGVKKRYESKNFTPNKQSRVSTIEGSQSYTLSYNKDIDLNGVLDNQKRPVSELFFSVIWKGYFGYTMGLNANTGLKQGYEFNKPLVQGFPSPWWRTTNGASETDFELGVYNTLQPVQLGPNNGPIPFTYVKSLKSGDIIEGDICEWNDTDQRERVVSKLTHKFTFNPFVFDISETDNNSNQLGYYYEPHYSLKIREYSDYIEDGDKKNVAGIPDYSYFSVDGNKFIWRDLYPYGYIDSSGIGVNYPFLNDTHYPYDNFIFRIIPEGTNYIEQTITQEPIIDDCE